MTLTVKTPTPSKDLVDREEITLNDAASRLAKSATMTAGYGISPDTQTDAGALKVESLDPQIKNLTYGTNDFTLYPALVSKALVQAKSTVEKYIQYVEHGRVGHSMFSPEVGISDLNAPKIRQKTVNMKYITDTRQQSFASMVAATVANPEEIQERDSVVAIGKTIEWAIFYGDADLTSQGEGQGLEFDGLSKLIDPNNKLDLRGTTLTPEVINQAAVIVKMAFGTPTDAYMPVGALADFSNQFLGAQRIVMPTKDGMTAGTNVNNFISAGGTINLHGSTVMDIDNILNEGADVNTAAPAQVTVTAAVNTNKGGNWLSDLTDANTLDNAGKPIVIRTGDIGVEQSYKVVAVGRHGDSIPSEAVTATPANATDGITLTIAIAAMQAEIPDYVAVYRQGPRSGRYYLIGRVPVSQLDDNGQLTFTDVDARIPETADVFLGQLDPQVISLYQFIPMSRVNLAVTTSATSFMLMWSGALALFNPKRWVQISNVRYNLYAPNENHMLGLRLSGYTK